MRISQVVSEAFKSWLSTKRAEFRHRSDYWTALCLHEVTDPRAFQTLLSELEPGYRMVSLSEGLRSLRAGSNGKPLLTLTFDDADKTVWQNCLPQLRNRQIPACLFVCTGFVEAGHRDVSTGRYPVMSWEDLKDWVDAGLEVGTHTVNHIPLNQATLDRAKWEILESKSILERRLNCEVRHVAYPWGYFTKQLDNWLEGHEGISTICTTIPCDNYPNRDGKHVHRKPAPRPGGHLNKDLRNPTLYETLRAAHQRSILNGLAPVVWRMNRIDSEPVSGGFGDWGGE